MANLLKVYEFKNCSTCKKAQKWLISKKIAFEAKDIITEPPTLKELEKMLSYVGDIKKLFNTSGQVYREMNLAKKISNITQKEAFALLAQNGKLVRRPFVIGHDFGFVGFKEDEWKKKI